MARFSRFRPVVHSDKHEITWSNLAQDASVTKIVTFSNAVQPTAKNASTEVLIGSQVRSIYLEFHFSADVITNPKVIHWKVEVLPGGLAPTIANSYYQIDRRFIIKRGMEMLPKSVSTVYKRIFVVRIPRKYQRQSESQLIQLRYQCSSAEAINACGIAIYKEYS